MAFKDAVKNAKAKKKAPKGKSAKGGKASPFAKKGDEKDMPKKKGKC